MRSILWKNLTFSDQLSSEKDGPSKYTLSYHDVSSVGSPPTMVGVVVDGFEVEMDLELGIAEKVALDFFKQCPYS